MYRYKVEESDLKATFSPVYMVLDIILIGLIVGTFNTRFVFRVPLVGIGVFAIILLYLVFAIVRTRMNALTPGMEYIVTPAKWGVVFKMVSTTDILDDDLELQLLVPFIRIKESTVCRNFSLYKLCLYVGEEDKIV